MQSNVRKYKEISEYAGTRQKMIGNAGKLWKNVRKCREA
jgi:hypothetical protein